MKKYLLPSHLIVKQSTIHGFGVFADKDFAPDETIEECYTILTGGMDKALRNYYFSALGQCAILTGFGLIYNHSDQPNATYYYDELNKVTVFKARQPIKKGEEIFNCYGENWFECRAMHVKKKPWLRKALDYSTGTPLRVGIVLGALFLIIQLMHAFAVA